MFPLALLQTCTGTHRWIALVPLVSQVNSVSHKSGSSRFHTLSLIPGVVLAAESRKTTTNPTESRTNQSHSLTGEKREEVGQTRAGLGVRRPTRCPDVPGTCKSESAREFTPFPIDSHAVSPFLS